MQAEMSDAEAKLREEILTSLRAAVATCKPGAGRDFYRELASRAVASAIPITGTRDWQHYEDLIIELLPIMRVAGASEDEMVAFVFHTVLATPEFIHDFWERLTARRDAESGESSP